ncbi:hypothetical protein [Burkholderia multivorans]|uniref:hypothetical protein n=1 Tax=Burkholderia multivorans TaxID=87883 RepID=UPI00158A6330|nr:hypothetical protein [Burkholderia multivorans]
MNQINNSVDREAEKSAERGVSETTSEIQQVSPTPVYAAFANNESFVAFWKSGENEITFYTPSSIHETQFTSGTQSFLESREHYEERGDLNGFDETVNAAWHILGQQMMFLDKSKVESSKIPLGTYWPRIWRGWYSGDYTLSTYNPIDARMAYQTKFVQSTVAASSLFAYLIEIFRNVEPASENLSVFGHKIRELLILVCTEVEAGWRAVLEANTKTRKKSYRTDDYFRTKEPLRLGEWSVALKDYPNLGEFSPFSKWTKECPTKSLAWYDSYNAAKHDRETNFSRANLGDLLSAMAALHIVQAAQWGPELFDRLYGDHFSPFFVTKWPKFRASEVYVPHIGAEKHFSPFPYFSD